MLTYSPQNIMISEEWGVKTDSSEEQENIIQYTYIIQNVYAPQFLNRFMFVRGNPYRLFDPDGKNARVYLDRNAVYGLGHISVGVDSPNQKGYEYRFENGGIGKDYVIADLGFTKISTESELVRQAVSTVTSNYDAENQVIFQKVERDAKGNVILSKGIEYYEIIQNVDADKKMIAEGFDQTTKKWKYNTFIATCLQYTNTILKANGEGLDKMYLLAPTFVFDKNKYAQGVTPQNAVQTAHDRNTNNGCTATYNPKTGGYNYKC